MIINILNNKLLFCIHITAPIYLSFLLSLVTSALVGLVSPSDKFTLFSLK